jgi:hypothetical protein
MSLVEVATQSGKVSPVEHFNVSTVFVRKRLRFAVRDPGAQGLDNRLITAPANDNADPARPIARRERLGGLLSYYYRAVA